MKVRAIKSWQDFDGKWIIAGKLLELDDPLPYLEAGLVVPVHRKIETAIRQAPEAIKESM